MNQAQNQYPGQNPDKDENNPAHQEPNNPQRQQQQPGNPPAEDRPDEWKDPEEPETERPDSSGEGEPRGIPE